MSGKGGGSKERRGAQQPSESRVLESRMEALRVAGRRRKMNVREGRCSVGSKEDLLVGVLVLLLGREGRRRVGERRRGLGLGEAAVGGAGAQRRHRVREGGRGGGREGGESGGGGDEVVVGEEGGGLPRPRLLRPALRLLLPDRAPPREQSRTAPAQLAFQEPVN